MSRSSACRAETREHFDHATRADTSRHVDGEALAAKAHGMPAIGSYSHVQAALGTVVRYEFDGTSYRAVGSIEIDGERYDALLRDLAQVPKP